MWVDRAFTIDGTGKVITGTASKSFDYKNIIFNLHNKKLQIKEIQNRDAINQENNETKRIAISLKKTNDSFPKRGDLLTNKEIVSAMTIDDRRVVGGNGLNRSCNKINLKGNTDAEIGFPTE